MEKNPVEVSYVVIKVHSIIFLIKKIKENLIFVNVSFNKLDLN